jgi:hypothetical protein
MTFDAPEIDVSVAYNKPPVRLSTAPIVNFLALANVKIEVTLAINRETPFYFDKYR